MTKLKNVEQALVGVISDTHGALWPEAVKSLRGSDVILHAGDIGKSHVIEALQKIAPVVAVRGNMDTGDWTRTLPDTALAEIGNVMLYLLHDVHRLDLEPSAAGISAVISGHTHRPSVAEVGNVLFLNPGSAAYPRHTYPASLALLYINGKTLNPRFVNLKL
jgi:putative phosphoesterase